MEVTLEFAVETGTKADNSREYSMREIGNFVVSLPGNLSNNSMRQQEDYSPCWWIDGSDDSGEE